LYTGGAQPIPTLFIIFFSHSRQILEYVENSPRSLPPKSFEVQGTLNEMLQFQLHDNAKISLWKETKNGKSGIQT
jgi:hypothetical protein